MNPLSQAVISGLMSGAVYALLAIGLIIAFRTSAVLNLAHGESFAIGGIISSLAAAAGMPYVLVAAAGITAAIAFAIAMERFLLRPRWSWPKGSLILLTLAAAFLSRGVLRVIAGTDPLSFPRLFEGPPIRIFDGVLPLQGLALIVVGYSVAIAVALLLARTEFGHRLYATAENPDVAELMGIDVERIRMLAFGLAGLLGGIAAVLLIPLVSVDFQVGLAMTLRGFIVAALAGMSPILAIFAGLILGLSEGFVTLQLGALAQDPIIFLALIIGAIWQARYVRFGGSHRA